MQTQEPIKQNTPNAISIRDRLIQEIAGTSNEILPEILDFVLFVKMRRSQKKSTAASLLKYAGTWNGDDIEDCLQLVRETRGQFDLANGENENERI